MARWSVNCAQKQCNASAAAVAANGGRQQRGARLGHCCLPTAHLVTRHQLEEGAPWREQVATTATVASAPAVVVAAPGLSLQLSQPPPRRKAHVVADENEGPPPSPSQPLLAGAASRNIFDSPPVIRDSGVASDASPLTLQMVSTPVPAVVAAADAGLGNASPGNEQALGGGE